MMGHTLAVALMGICIFAPLVPLKIFAFFGQCLVFSWQMGRSYGRKWGLHEGRIQGAHATTQAFNQMLPTIISTARHTAADDSERESADWWKGGEDAKK
jgi:hypothetical protein